MQIILKLHMRVYGEEILHIVVRQIHMQKKVCFAKNFNFIREHFTTKKVPAVAIGIIEKPVTWNDLLMMNTC